MIEDVGRCQRCGKFLIAEEFDSHKCDIKISDVKEIVVDHYHEFSQPDPEGHRLILAQGLDGVQYWLVECKHNPPHNTRRDFTGSPNRRRLDSTMLAQYLLD